MKNKFYKFLERSAKIYNAVLSYFIYVSFALFCFNNSLPTKEAALRHADLPYESIIIDGTENRFTDVELLNDYTSYMVDFSSDYAYVVQFSYLFEGDIIYDSGLNTWSYVGLFNLDVNYKCFFDDNFDNDIYYDNFPRAGSFGFNDTSFIDFNYHSIYSNSTDIWNVSCSYVTGNGSNRTISLYDESVTLSNSPFSDGFSFNWSWSLVMSEIQPLLLDCLAEYNSSFNAGYTKGYAEGYDYAIETGGVATEIFTGILSVGMLPINFFLDIFEFEILGIQIGSVVAALLTCVVVVLVTKKVIGN